MKTLTSGSLTWSSSERPSESKLPYIQNIRPVLRPQSQEQQEASKMTFQVLLFSRRQTGALVLRALGKPFAVLSQKRKLFGISFVALFATTNLHVHVPSPRLVRELLRVARLPPDKLVSMMDQRRKEPISGMSAQNSGRRRGTFNSARRECSRQACKTIWSVGCRNSRGQILDRTLHLVLFIRNLVLFLLLLQCFVLSRRKSETCAAWGVRVNGSAKSGGMANFLSHLFFLKVCVQQNSLTKPIHLSLAITRQRQHNANILTRPGRKPSGAA